jgi:hypothetical protein
VLNDYGEVNSATDSRFAQFLKNGFARYSSSSSAPRDYVLIMSDHGEGFAGVGTDHHCSSKAAFNLHASCQHLMPIRNIAKGRREAALHCFELQ